MFRTVLWIGVVIVIVLVGVRLLRTGVDPRSRDSAGRCLLRARVYTFGEGVAQPRRIFGVQNLDDAEWTDVQITIEGVINDREGNRPTGPYVQVLPVYDSAVAAKKSREVPLEDFKSAAGPRWVPLTMRVTRAHLEAKIAGEACTFDSAMPQP